MTRRDLLVSLVAGALLLFVTSVLFESAFGDETYTPPRPTPTRTTTDPAVAPATSGGPAAPPGGARGAAGSSAWPGEPPRPTAGGAYPAALSP